MQTTTLDFPRNARRVYTAVKHVFQTKTRFGNIDWDDVHFTVEARRGWFVSPFTESIKVKAAANGRLCFLSDDCLNICLLCLFLWLTFSAAVPTF